ncbi:hypothetical protein AB4298_18490 [Shewanella sp. 10N.261.52.F9]|uniref:hypothetical protein n=1 Tax=Shewanella sp. 10N.261.52.F9 TaxID=3229684 RepID=UPI003553720D
MLTASPSASVNHTPTQNNDSSANTNKAPARNMLTQSGASATIQTIDSTKHSSSSRQTQPAINNQDTVSLSEESIKLSATNKNDAQVLANRPNLPNEGEKAEVYIEYKKAKMQYQIYADMANVVTGNNSGVSPMTAHYLVNNDDARAATVNAKAQQQQIATMQTYASTSQNLNEQS